jgi:hypothetical protein
MGCEGGKRVMIVKRVMGMMRVMGNDENDSCDGDADGCQRSNNFLNKTL